MKLFIFSLILFFSISIVAQNLPRNDVQSWNEVTVSKSLLKSKDKNDKEFDRVSIFFNGTLRVGNKVKTLIDERIGFGFDIKINHFLTLTPSYLYRSNKPTLNSREYENRFRLAATLEKKWKRFSIKDRNLIEYRLRNSQTNSTRYRNKFTFTYPILKNNNEIFAPFIGDEVFYDFSANRWSRNEISVGISKKFNKNLSSDFYYVHQNNRTGAPKTVSSFGVSLKIKLD